MNKAKRILTTTGYTTQLEKSIVLSCIEELEQKVNQLESTINEIIDWKDKNGNRYIYQDSLGEDWYFYDLDVFDELGEILNEVGDFNG